MLTVFYRSGTPRGRSLFSLFRSSAEFAIELPKRRSGIPGKHDGGKPGYRFVSLEVLTRKFSEGSNMPVHG
jgi:hypothetical protein